MAQLRLSRVELQIMETMWQHGRLAIREIQEHMPKGKSRAYSTVQTMVYRLEAKGAVRRARKISNAQFLKPRFPASRCNGAWPTNSLPSSAAPGRSWRI